MVNEVTVVVGEAVVLVLVVVDFVTVSGMVGVAMVLERDDSRGS